MSNNLFPVFLKPDNLRFLLVGGGDAAEEKATHLFRHCDSFDLTVITKSLNFDINSMKRVESQKVTLFVREFQDKDIALGDVIIIATENYSTNNYIRGLAKSRNKLINVVDTPDLCDFYLGSVIKKGDLKVAISTNGKSPTLSKRMREFFDDVLPEEIDDLLEELSSLRQQLKGDISEKIKVLNNLTSNFKRNE